QSAQNRIDAVLGEIKKLRQSEFPSPQPERALKIFEARFQGQKTALGRIFGNQTGEVVRNACIESLRDIQYALPILGFLLRATNIRNAFEVNGPLQRLAKSIL